MAYSLSLGCCKFWAYYPSFSTQQITKQHCLIQGSLSSHTQLMGISLQCCSSALPPKSSPKITYRLLRAVPSACHPPSAGKHSTSSDYPSPCPTWAPNSDRLFPCMTSSILFHCHHYSPPTSRILLSSLVSTGCESISPMSKISSKALALVTLQFETSSIPVLYWEIQIVTLQQPHISDLSNGSSYFLALSPLFTEYILAKWNNNSLLLIFPFCFECQLHPVLSFLKSLSRQLFHQIL